MTLMRDTHRARVCPSPRSVARSAARMTSIWRPWAEVAANIGDLDRIRVTTEELESERAAVRVLLG